jgi:hypothetical protein
MKTFFAEKHIVITDAEGERLEFFMRPIKIKELPIINRISVLAESEGTEEFTTPMLLSLMIDCLSIDGANVPGDATDDLIKTFIDYNFPKPDETKTQESKRSKTKKDPEPISFFIDFLVNQGHSVSDIKEFTMSQFNELIMKAGERLNPKSKVMDPLEAFAKMGIPIRKRVNGR